MGKGVKNIAKSVWAFIVRKAKKVFQYLKVAKMEWIVMISVFALDLVAKFLVEKFLAFDDSVTMIPYFLNAHKVHNYAAAFGSGWLNSWMGNIGSRIFYCVFAVAASVAFILVLIRNKGKSRVFRIAVALFVAGAMGNCIDRMVFGYVRDFIEFVYFGLTINDRTTWAYIFNIADVALVTGVILIVFYFLFLYRDSDKKKIEFSIDTVSEDEPENSDNTASVGESAASADTESADSTVSDSVDASGQSGTAEQVPNDAGASEGDNASEAESVNVESKVAETESGGGDNT